MRKVVFVGRRCDHAKQSDPFPSFKTRSSEKNRRFIDHLTHCLKRFAARNIYRCLVSLPWLASCLQIIAALDSAVPRNQGGHNSRRLRPALVRISCRRYACPSRSDDIHQPRTRVGGKRDAWSCKRRNATAGVPRPEPNETTVGWDGDSWWGAGSLRDSEKSRGTIAWRTGHRGEHRAVRTSFALSCGCPWSKNPRFAGWGTVRYHN